jgi:hypothetical protein
MFLPRSSRLSGATTSQAGPTMILTVENWQAHASAGSSPVTPFVQPAVLTVLETLRRPASHPTNTNGRITEMIYALSSVTKD